MRCAFHRGQSPAAKWILKVPSQWAPNLPIQNAKASWCCDVVLASYTRQCIECVWANTYLDLDDSCMIGCTAGSLLEFYRQHQWRWSRKSRIDETFSLIKFPLFKLNLWSLLHRHRNSNEWEETCKVLSMMVPDALESIATGSVSR